MVDLARSRRLRRVATSSVRSARGGRPSSAASSARQTSSASPHTPIVPSAVPVELVGVDVDLHDRHRVVGLPVHDRPLEPGADADHDVGRPPQVVTDGEVHEQRMRGRDGAVTHAAGGDRRLEQLGERRRPTRRHPARRRRRRSAAAARGGARRRHARPRRGRRWDGWPSAAGARRARRCASDRRAPRCSPAAGGPTPRASSAACSCVVAASPSSSRVACLVSCDRIACWSTSSCSTPNPRPRARGGDLADDREHPRVRPVARW